MDESLEIREPRVYEVGYHVLPTVGADSVSATVDSLKKIISSFGGLQIREGEPQLMSLAYPMAKIIDNKRTSFEQAYFGWIVFDVQPDKVGEVEEAFRAHPDILRFLLISAPREDVSVLNKRPMRPDVREVPDEDAKNPSKADDGEVAPVDEEALDEKLDDIVSPDEA